MYSLAEDGEEAGRVKRYPVRYHRPPWRRRSSPTNGRAACGACSSASARTSATCEAARTGIAALLEEVIRGGNRIRSILLAQDESEVVELDPATQEQLRELGYLE